MAKKIPSDIEKRIALTEKASKSLEAYNEEVKATQILHENILYIDKKRAEIAEELASAEKANNDHKKGVHKLSNAELKEVKKTIRVKKASLQTETDLLVQARELLEIKKEALKNVNKINLAKLHAKNIGEKLGKQALRQRGYLFEQEKSVRATELSMGILSNQSEGFRNNIYKTALTTNQIGVNVKELSQLQGTYSDNIGRSVQLSESQLTAMSELAKGTMMGVEGAAEFSANMESFGLSAEGSAEYIDEVLSTSTKLGNNSNKVIKNIQKNIKLLNKFNFKNGVKGLGKMANLATKFKFEMSSIANFAEKVMTPEGAVETAAKLQVLGGQWAKLGDPFELMYRSRNDMAGLTKDIISATTATARFDKTNGNVTIDPMEMQRLREVANATGMEYDSLAESARQAAKFTAIENQISGIFTPEDKTLLSSMATWDDEKKGFKVTMVNEDGVSVTENINSLRDITPELVKSQREFTRSLKDRAKDAQTFDETWVNLKNTVKTLLLPGFTTFTKALQSSVGDFHVWAKENKVFDKMASFGKVIGEMGAWLIKLATNNPFATAGVLLAGKAAQWILNGKFLRMGFNMGGGGFNGTSNGKGGGASNSKGGGTSNSKGGGKGIGSKLFNTKTGAGMSKMGKMGMNFKRATRSGGALGAGALSGLLSGYFEYAENSDMGMDLGENIGRTVAKGGAAGVGAWGGAAAGAAIGSVVGPVGTLIGGLIGGALGAWGGDVAGESLGDWKYGDEMSSKKSRIAGKTHQDFISRPNEPLQSFSPKDTIVGAKSGGPIDIMLNKSINSNKIDSPETKTTQNILPGNNSDNNISNELLNSIKINTKKDKIVVNNKKDKASSGKVLVNFNKPLTIEGKLDISSNGSDVEIPIDDPIFMRELSQMIQKELSKAISGGKISSNPTVIA